MKLADMAWVDFGVKRKMKRTFTEDKLMKYIFGEEYKERPKEPKHFLEWQIKDYKKTVEKYARNREVAVANGETDEEYLNHIYGAGFQKMRIAENEKKIADGDYLQTAEDYDYRKEWHKRWCYFEACVWNARRSANHHTTIYNDEYNFKTKGYDWDQHTGVLTYENVPAAMDKEANKEFNRIWSKR